MAAPADPAPNSRLLEAIRQAQSAFILNSGTREEFRILLDAALALTGSEYGFIGEVEESDSGDAQLRVWAYTDIAWNEDTRQLLRENASTGLVFTNMNTLFGHAIVHDEVVIANAAPDDPRAGGLPPGHPPLNAFLGLPFHFDEQPIGLIGLANRSEGYDQALVDFLEPLVTTCGVLGHARMVAESRNREQQTLEIADRTQRLMEFSQRLAHDLNNLLTVIHCTVDAQRHVKAAGKDTSSLDLIHSATVRAAELTRKIMSFAGSTAVNRQAVLPRQALSEAIGIAAAFIPNNVEVQSEIIDELPAVFADPTELHQTLLNILLNATEAIGEDSGIITVAAKPSRYDTVEIIISDTGHGMDEATKARAFDPYFSTKERNRGFGLTSVMGFLKSNASRFELESVPNEGTTFRFALPVIQTTPEEETQQGMYDFTGKRILVVDDEVAVANSIQMLLQHNNADAISVNHGRAALAQLEHDSTFDLILTDISMPEIDGVELVHQIRNDLKLIIPTVLMTGYTDRAMPESIAKESSLTFIRKPFSREELRSACATVAPEQS